MRTKSQRVAAFDAATETLTRTAKTWSRVEFKSTRKRYRAVTPILSRRAEMPEGVYPAGSEAKPSSISYRVMFSEKEAIRYLNAGNAPGYWHRWAAIIEGVLPEDEREDFPAPLVGEALDRAEAEALDKAEAEAAEKQAALDRATRSTVDRLNAEAEELRATTGRGRPAALAKARRLDRDAEKAVSDAEDKAKDIADELRKNRALARSRLEAENTRRAEAIAKRVAALRAGLEDEVRAFLDDHWKDIELAEFGEDEHAGRPASRYQNITILKN